MTKKILILITSNKYKMTHKAKSLQINQFSLSETLAICLQSKNKVNNNNNYWFKTNKINFPKKN